MDDTMAELARHLTTHDHQRASAAAALLMADAGER